MEKKAKRFVRLLAKTLIENEHTRDAKLQDTNTVKQAFRNALDELPKSALKTELQKNAATYFRRLEKLTKNGRARGGQSRSLTSKEQDEDEPPRGQLETQDADVEYLEASDAEPAKAEDMGCVLPSQKTKKASQHKGSGRKAASSLTKDESDKDMIHDGIALVTHHSERELTVRRDEHSGALLDDRSVFAYNIFATDARSTVVDSLAKLPLEKKWRLAPHAYASLCTASSFKEFLQTIHPDDEDKVTSDTLSLLRQEILASIGTSDVKVFIRCVADCLSGIMKEADEILSTKNTDRLKELQAFILNFFLWAKIQRGVHKQGQHKQAHSLTYFDDLMAAILSIYVDVSILSSRDSQDEAGAHGRRALSKILLLLGHSPVHQFNVLLQATLPTSRDSQFMLPIYKHMLSKKPNPMTNEMLVKYVCAVRFCREILQDHQPKVVRDILNVAATAEPSREFLEWLFSAAPDAYSSLPDAVKIRKVPVVKYLTEQAPRKYLDRLLDILFDDGNEGQILSHEDGQGQDQDQGPPSSQDDQAEASGTEGLFFTDTSRDEDLARQADSDLESVDALHSRLDTLMEDMEPEESSDDDDDLYQAPVIRSPSSESKGKVDFGDRHSGEPLTPQNGHSHSDHEELDMDTSPASEGVASETLSFEEQRHRFMMEGQRKKTKIHGIPENDKGSAQTRQGSTAGARSQKSLSLGLTDNEHLEDSLVVTESQLIGRETDSDKESFSTAKDNLDTTKESIVIDVDDEITFRVKSSRLEEKLDSDSRRNAEDGEDEVEDVEECNANKDESGDDTGAEVKNKLGSAAEKPGRSSKSSPTKQSTRSPRKSEGALKDADKKQEQVSDETSGSTQRMCLRSAGTSHNQSSLLRFFSPVRRSGEESSNDAQPTQTAQKVIRSGSNDVEVVPDSCGSSDGKEQNAKADGSRTSTPRRAKNLKSLQGIATNSEQTLQEKKSSPGTVDAAEPDKQAGTPTRKKRQKRLFRSARKTRGSEQRASSSSGSDVEPVLLVSPVFKASRTDTRSAKSSGQDHSVVEDVVSAGIRRIREECATSPGDLQQPLVTRSASKLKSSKRKPLTITGGLKSKTQNQASKQAEMTTATTTPACKTVPKSGEKRQGVSPLSPSKVKRAATFGNTYRMLAGISADSQTTDTGSLPASQSQRTSPKRARLQPKSLREMFTEDPPSSQKRSAKIQKANVQLISGSSQESAKLGRSDKSDVKTPAEKRQSPKPLRSRRTSTTASQSSQDSMESPGKLSKRAKAKVSPVADPSDRVEGISPRKAALKRRASLPPSKSTTMVKVTRKSTGAKK